MWKYGNPRGELVDNLGRRDRATFEGDGVGDHVRDFGARLGDARFCEHRHRRAADEPASKISLMDGIGERGAL